MNCDSVCTLLDEIPTARWTIRQQVLVEEHCDGCDACSLYLQEQRDLDYLFEDLQEPVLTGGLHITTDAQPLEKPVEHPGIRAPMFITWPGLAGLLVCVGSAYKLMSTGGITPRWYVDGGFFESAASFMINTPVLSAFILLLALLFSFSPAPRIRRDG